MVGLRSSAAIALLVVFVCMAHGTPYTLSNMPAYNWYHGCGPTAAASVIGYWDLLGYTNLFDASGADVYQTSNVQDQISSPAHNAKYDPHPDDPDLPVPPNTSIACWFRTSVGQPYGWSYLSYSDDAFSGYAQYRGYTFNSWYQGFGTGAGEFYWDDFMDEIDAGRPLMFLVDTDGNNVTDHFVPAFGYDDRGAEGLYYACYDTWRPRRSGGTGSGSCSPATRGVSQPSRTPSRRQSQSRPRSCCSPAGLRCWSGDAGGKRTSLPGLVSHMFPHHDRGPMALCRFLCVADALP